LVDIQWEKEAKVGFPSFAVRKKRERTRMPYLAENQFQSSSFQFYLLNFTSKVNTYFMTYFKNHFSFGKRFCECEF